MPSASELLAKLSVEARGTALLCFTIGTAAGRGAPLAAVAIGCTLMAAIYSGGHLSGAMYNPAVSLAVLVRGKLPPCEFVAYVLAQLVGALIGGGSASVLEAQWGTGIGFPALAPGVTAGSAFLAEAIWTFSLCNTILHVATSTRQANNSYYGLAIGFTVLSGALAVGGVSGGCFNPAVALLAVFQPDLDVAVRHLYVSILGPLVGGALAGALFRITHPQEVHGRASGSARGLAPLATEFVGTFMLALAIATSAGVGSPLAPFAIGAMLMCQVYTGGATSGAHYNPAVTIGVLARRQVN